MNFIVFFIFSIVLMIGFLTLSEWLSNRYYSMLPSGCAFVGFIAGLLLCFLSIIGGVGDLFTTEATHYAVEQKRAAYIKMIAMYQQEDMKDAVYSSAYKEIIDDVIEFNEQCYLAQKQPYGWWGRNITWSANYINIDPIPFNKSLR